MDAEFHTRAVKMCLHNVEDANNKLSLACAKLLEFFSLESCEVMEDEAQDRQQIVEFHQKDRREAISKLENFVPNWRELYPELSHKVAVTTQDVACALDQLDAVRAEQGR